MKSGPVMPTDCTSADVPLAIDVLLWASVIGAIAVFLAAVIVTAAMLIQWMRRPG